jgi:hypothetical protein
MASDYDNDTSVNTSEYSIELGSTTSLVFTTKIKFIYYLIQIIPPHSS